MDAILCRVVKCGREGLPESWEDLSQQCVGDDGFAAIVEFGQQALFFLVGDGHFAGGDFLFANEHRLWPARPGPRRAGVSAFGLGGSNVHVVLEEPPAQPEPVDRPGPHLLTISGRDETAVDQATEKLLRHLDRHPELTIADVAFTLQQSRSYFPVRRAIVCADAADARRMLGEPRLWLTAKTHLRDPLVDLVLADPAPEPQWAAQVEEAARRISRPPDRPPSRPPGRHFARPV